MSKANTMAAINLLIAEHVKTAGHLRDLIIYASSVAKGIDPEAAHKLASIWPLIRSGSFLPSDQEVAEELQAQRSERRQVLEFRDPVQLSMAERYGRDL